MKKFVPTTFAKLTLGAMVATLLTWSARAEDADISTPKKAGIAFAKAVDAGDMDAAKKLATGGETEWKVISTLGNLSRAMTHLRTALTKQFGDKAQLPPGMDMSLTSDFETRDEKIEGEKATLISKRDPDDKYPPTLKKVAKGWQLDLSNISQDPNLQGSLAAMEPIAKVMNTVATDVEAGKYKSMEEVMDAMRKAQSGGQ